MKKLFITLLLSVVTLMCYSQNYKFGKVSKEELEEKVHPFDSTAKAAFLLKKMNIFYEYDGERGWTLITEVHERIKLYSKEDIAAATKAIKLYQSGGVIEKVSSLKAYTYNLVEGKIKKDKLNKKQIFKETTSKNWSKEIFTMPNLQDGSVLEWSYKKKSPYYSFIDDIAFQHRIPIKKIDIRIRVPEYFVFKKHYKGYLFTYFEESKKNRSINYSYRAEKNQSVGAVSASSSRYSEKVSMMEQVSQLTQENIPAMKFDEPYISSVQKYIGGVTFELNMTKFPNQRPSYHATTWENIVKRVYRSSKFGGELSKRNYFKDDLQNILKTATTNGQKIGAIFQFVKTKVKWNGNYGVYTEKGVKKAYKEGVGNTADINFILVSMLREAGLNANPVLVSTRNNDSGVLNVPTLNGFNYVVATILIGNSNVVLDATEVYSEPNVLPLRAVTRQGRVVMKGGVSTWLDLTPNKLSLEEKKLYINFDADFNVKGMLRTRHTNLLALNFRNSKNHLKEEGIIEGLEEKYKIEIDDYKAVNKIVIGKPVGQNIKFVGDEMAEIINNKVYISPLLFLTKKVNPFKLKERKFPVDFGVPFNEKTSVSIEVPAGYKVEVLPKPVAVSIGDNMAVFGYKIVSKGKKINVISQLRVNSPIITPEYYQELKEFYSQMVKKQTQKIVLVKE